MKKGLFLYKCITCILVTALLAQPFSYPAFAETTSEKIKKAEELKKQTEAQKEEVEQKKDALEDEKAELIRCGFQALSEEEIEI